MYCPYCGTEIPDGYDFCPIDGSRVNREPQDKDKHSWAEPGFRSFRVCRCPFLDRWKTHGR